MQNLLNQNIATHYEKYLEEKGIDFMFSAPYTVTMKYEVVSLRIILSFIVSSVLIPASPNIQR